MESDEIVNENLRLQFKALQEQQQKRLQRLMERKKEKEQLQSQKIDQKTRDAFGVKDELSLLKNGGDSSSDVRNRLLEDENEQLQDQLRETRDENGRLTKLVKEKEFEIKHLRKKIEENKLTLAGTTRVAGDVAAIKIVELSKKNRELVAEMESEKTKVKQLSNKIKEMEKELLNTTGKSQCSPGKESGIREPVLKSAEQNNTMERTEIKTLQEKLTAANIKLTEYRNHIQSVKQELKMAHKVLVNEIGEDVNIPQLVTSAGSWRGRAQQILALQGRIRELENQLGRRSPVPGLSLEEEMLGIPAAKRYAAQEKNLFRLRALEKDKKETLEKLTSENDALKKDHEELKKKLDASKSRSKVLSSDVKTMRMQMATLIEKGKHDDELVDALLIQQKSMQEVLHRLSQQDQKDKQSTETLASQLNSEAQKHSSLVAQLKDMVAEREAKVTQLEVQIKRLTLRTNLDTPHSGSSFDAPKDREDVTSAMSSGSARSLSEFGSVTARPGSGRIISKLGHELLGSTAAQPSLQDHGVSPQRYIDNSTSTELRSLQTQIAQFRGLCQAAEVERDRLLELVSVLHKRVEESSQKALHAEKTLQEERRRCVVLEQQLEKMRMDMTKNTQSRGKMGQSLTNSRHFLSITDRIDSSYTVTSDVPLETQIEELNTKLAIQTEENEALKIALKDTFKTKGDDLKLYHEMMGEVKQIFLQALRQYKQERNAV